ncbi:MAG: DUF305 domain-containing protein [Acidobacteriota bacterium]
MKTTILTLGFGLVVIGFAACNLSPSNAGMNHNGINMNGNTATDHNAMPMNANHDMSDAHYSEMKSSPNAASQPYDLQFIDTMTHHHQGAIDMAKMVLVKSQDDELKTFAQKIIGDQTREIRQMKDWRDKWYSGKPAALNMEMPGMADSMKMMMGDDMKKMEAATGKEFDLMFLDMMKPHHAGAIAMSKEALTKAEHAEVKTLANQIIKEQEAEIKQIEAWKSFWSK